MYLINTFFCLFQQIEGKVREISAVISELEKKRTAVSSSVQNSLQLYDIKRLKIGMLTDWLIMQSLPCTLNYILP